MKKTFALVLISISLLTIISYFGIFGLAKVSATDTDGIELPNPIHATTTEALINNILNFIWEVALAATPAMIVIGGLIITTSAGNPEQARTGKNTIIWALVGFSLILLSKGLFALIKTMIGA